MKINNLKDNFYFEKQNNIINKGFLNSMLKYTKSSFKHEFKT